MNQYYVYRHIRLDTNTPFYVGTGKGNRAYEKCKSKRGEFWNNIVNKYGYRVEIMMRDLTEDFAFQKEIYFIKLYRDLGLCEANFTDGGEGLSNPSQDTRIKISRSLGGKPFNVYNYKTEEFVEMYETQHKCIRDLNLLRSNLRKCLVKERYSHRGYYFRYLDEDQSIDKNKPNPNLGKKRTLEQRNKLSLAKGCGYFDVWEVKIKRGSGKRIVSIEKIKHIGEWVNVSECSRKLNVNQGLIRDCLIGKQKTTNNKYIFEYKKGEINE